MFNCFMEVKKVNSAYRVQEVDEQIVLAISEAVKSSVLTRGDLISYHTFSQTDQFYKTDYRCLWLTCTPS